MSVYNKKNQIGTTKNYVESRISGAASGYNFVVTDGSTPATINSGNTLTFAGTSGVTVSQSGKTVTITGSSSANYYVTGATLGGSPNYTLSLARNGGLSDVTVNLSSFAVGPVTPVGSNAALKLPLANAILALGCTLKSSTLNAPAIFDSCIDGKQFRKLILSAAFSDDFQPKNPFEL